MTYPVDDEKARELRNSLLQMVMLDDEAFNAFLSIGRMYTLRKGELLWSRENIAGSCAICFRAISGIFIFTTGGR
ncbi:MAG: hypothetical protein U5L09_17385 [Bacteroidales bacterium]|nr:hypothetical protein [Bacteroidales bacterium]